MANRKRDYYEVLGVQRDADAEEIKRTYRKLAMQYHPDRNVGDAAAEVKFKEAAEAYEVLHDLQKRQRYDHYGHAGLEGMNVPHFHDPQSVIDLFGDIFGEFFGGRRGRSGPQPGRDLQVGVEIELVEAARGVQKTVAIAREESCADCSGNGCQRGTNPATCRRCGGQGVVVQAQGFFRVQQTCRGCGGRGVVITDPCGGCHGSGRVLTRRTIDVAIPPGVDTGTRIRLTGEGEVGEAGAPRGDLYCAIRVGDHPFFQRDGNHLVCQVPITVSQAVLGGEIQIPTLNGAMSHKLRSGVQSGDIVRLTGKGIPSLRGGYPGDLMVQVIVETPKNLTKRQEELFRELAELEQSNVSPQRKSFLEKLRGFFAAQTGVDSTGASS